MKKVIQNLFIICGVIFGLSLSACEEIFGEGYWEDGHYVGSQNSDYDDHDDEEDRLVVSGEGETILLKYNNLTFTAQLNWDDGNYYFAPDRDGSVSGHRSTCVVSIDDQSVEGNCFRDGAVCHFSYDDDSWSDGDEGDVYYLNSTTCKTAASVGPFLVPLDSPLCGEDPYPACPDDDLFPSGPTNDMDDNEDSDISDEDSDESEAPRVSIPAEVEGGVDSELPSPSK